MFPYIQILYASNAFDMGCLYRVRTGSKVSQTKFLSVSQGVPQSPVLATYIKNLYTYTVCLKLTWEKSSLPLVGKPPYTIYCSSAAMTPAANHTPTFYTNK